MFFVGPTLSGTEIVSGVALTPAAASVAVSLSSMLMLSGGPATRCDR